MVPTKELGLKFLHILKGFTGVVSDGQTKVVPGCWDCSTTRPACITWESFGTSGWSVRPTCPLCQDSGRSTDHRVDHWSCTGTRTGGSMAWHSWSLARHGRKGPLVMLSMDRLTHLTTFNNRKICWLPENTRESGVLSIICSSAVSTLARNSACSFHSDNHYIQCQQLDLRPGWAETLCWKGILFKALTAAIDTKQAWTNIMLGKMFAVFMSFFNCFSRSWSYVHVATSHLYHRSSKMVNHHRPYTYSICILYTQYNSIHRPKLPSYERAKQSCSSNRVELLFQRLISLHLNVPLKGLPVAARDFPGPLAGSDCPKSLISSQHLSNQ